MKIIKFIILTALIFMSASSNAETITPDSVVNMVMLAIKPAMSTLTTTAIAWLGAFATLQFVLTNINVLKTGGDIDTVWAKFLGSLMWIGICFYILTNGPQFIAEVGDSFFHIIGSDLPSAGDIISDALVLVGKMIVVSMVGAAIPAVGNTLGPIIVYIMIFNFAVSLLFAFKIFMVQLELGLIVMLSPLSFSFLGINALKDQGIAPFKSLISLGYRIILMTVIMVAYSTVSSVVGDEFAKFGNLSATDFLSTSAIAGLFKSVISAFGAYLILAYLLWKSDSIAASLAGGSTSMGTADVASAAAIGAAAGAVVASGGAAAAGAAAKPVQGMADFMKNMGGSGSVSNASNHGLGASGAVPSPDAPLSSLGGSGAGGGAPSAPTFETNSSGAPMRLRPEPEKAAGGKPTQSETPAHSASEANIGGRNFDQQPASQNQNSGGGKPFFGHLKEFGRQIEQDKAATHVSINTHHAD